MLLHLFIHNSLLGGHIASCLIFTFVLINEECIYWSLYVNKLKIDQSVQTTCLWGSREGDWLSSYYASLAAKVERIAFWVSGEKASPENVSGYI